MLVLTYPAYLDNTILSSLIASVEGGLAESSVVTHVNRDGGKGNAEIEGKAGVGAFLSKLLTLDIRGKMSAEMWSQFENQHSVTIKYPNALLFARLFDHLKSAGKVVDLESNSQFTGVKPGDFVSLRGVIKNDPSILLKKFIEVALPIYLGMQEAELSSFQDILELVGHATKANPIVIGETSVDNNNKQNQINQYKTAIAGKNIELRKLKTILPAIQPLLLGEASVLNAILLVGDSRLVVRMHVEFARMRHFEEILDSEWSVFGKVARVIHPGECFNFYDSALLSSINSGIVDKLIDSLKTTGFSKSDFIQSIDGHTLVITPIALYN